jgi:predicted signal transduction protein with EAL and GGDEF domain
MKLQNRIILPVVLLVVIPLTLLSMMLYQQIVHHSNRLLSEQAALIASNADSAFKVYQSNAITNIKQLFNDPFVQTYIKTHVQHHLETYNQDHANKKLHQQEHAYTARVAMIEKLYQYVITDDIYQEVSIILPDGNYDTLVTRDEPINITTSDWGSLSTSTISQRIWRDINNQPVLATIYPINMPNSLVGKSQSGSTPSSAPPRLFGFLVTVTNLNILADLAGKTRIGKYGFIQFIDDKGLRIGSNALGARNVTTADRGSEQAHHTSTPFNPSVLNLIGLNNQHDRRETFYQRHHALLPGLTLMSAVSSRDITEQANTLIRVAIIVLFFILLITAAVIYLLISQSVVQPVISLQKMVTSYQQSGTLIEHQFDESEEMQALSDAFISMCKHLDTSQLQIKKMAYYDELTGLANRFSLKEQLKLLTEQCQIDQGQFAVMFIDLDDFKHVNDSLGHDIGDELLKDVAFRLCRAVRVNDFIGRKNPGRLSDSGNSNLVARLGGDEFMIVTQLIKNPKEASNIATRLIETLSQSFTLKHYDVFVGASIGIAMYPNDSTNVDTLLKHADTAMYEAKALGKNHFQFFTPEMNAAVTQRLKIESALHCALSSGEFKLLFQPRVNVSNRSINGFEVLLRWDHEQYHDIGALKLIEIAEDIGIIQELGFWTLDKVCQSIRQWLDTGYTDFIVSLNLSPMQFQHGELRNMIDTLLKLHEVPAHHLEVEITESSLMQYEENIPQLMAKIKQTGVKITLDDFGIGYSSLTHLRNEHFDTLKIDRSFFTSEQPSEQDIAVLGAISELSRKLQLETVVIGIETQSQHDLITQLGFHHAQVFLYSPPIPFDQATELLSQQSFPNTGKAIGDSSAAS